MVMMAALRCRFGAGRPGCAVGMAATAAGLAALPSVRING
jgi:hypothetical protein